MSDPRITGLTLMAMAMAAFVGTTSNALPPLTFFPALAVFVAGATRFMKSNRQALENAEERAHRAVNPRISENRQAHAHAKRQAARQGSAPGPFGTLESNANSIALAGSGRVAPGESIEIETDVSFPVEIQSGDAMADQLCKLSRLLEQGALTSQEYAVAKAKLLG